MRLTLILSLLLVVLCFSSVAVHAQNTACSAANPQVCGPRGNCNLTTLKCDCHTNCNTPTTCGKYIDSPSGACTVFQPDTVPPPPPSGCSSNPQICGPNGNCQNNVCVCHANCNTPSTCGLWINDVVNGGYCNLFEQCQNIPAPLVSAGFPPLLCQFCPASAPAWDNGRCIRCTLDSQCANGNYFNPYVASDAALQPSKTVDASLVSGTGLVQLPNTNTFYTTDPLGGLIHVYDKDGNIVKPAISVPLPPNSTKPTSLPLGITYVASLSKFVIATGTGRLYTLDPVTDALTEVSARPNTVYTSVDVDGSGALLLATNYDPSARNLDVFSLAAGNEFAFLGNIAADAQVPTGYSPRFVQTSPTGATFVAWGKPDPTDALGIGQITGAGIGHVSFLNPQTGQLVKFATGGTLNTPSSVIASVTPGTNIPVVLVSNTGDGTFSLFLADGTYLYQVIDASGKLVRAPGTYKVVQTASGTAYAVRTLIKPDSNGLLTWGTFGAFSLDFTATCNKATGYCSNRLV